MKTALYVDDSGPRTRMIFLKEVDSANVANIFCCSGSTAACVSLAGESYPYNGLTGGG